MWKQMWIFWLICLLGSGVRAEDGPKKFPTAVGMTWIYRGNPREIALTARIADVERTADGAVFFWEGFQRRRVVRQTVDGKVMELEGGTWRLLFDLRAGEGASWTIEPFGMGDLLDGARVEVVSRSAEVRVPYATFQGAIHLKLISPNLADAGVTEVWFAEGVGLVKWVEQSIAGPQAYELATFTNGLEPPVIGPVDPPVVISPGEPEPIPDPTRPIETYQNRVSVERNGVRYEVGVLQSSYTQEDEMEMQYRVMALDRDVVFQFTSTQQFDFLLVNEQDTKVWVWSANRGFGDALTSLTLHQGESRGFVAALHLKNEILPSGSYRLIGFLPTSAFGGETVLSNETEVSVNVEIVGDPVRARVSGKVVDESGKPVAGTIVSLGQQVPLTPSPDAARSASVARTDRNGEFVLNGLVPGEYVVTVSKEGYHLSAQTISITPGFFQMRMEVRIRVPDGFENVHAQRHDRFLVELATDREVYAEGDLVRVRYRLINISGGSVRLMFPSGQRYDLTLDGQQGRIWQWSATRSFIQALSAQDLGVFVIG